MQRPQCLARISDSSDQPIILLPDSGLVGWSWQMDIENVTTSFEVAGISAQQQLNLEFSADGGSTWHRNRTDCAMPDFQNPSSSLEVTFN